MKPAVRQMRGPGMNLGLKKPRKKMPAPKPIKSASATAARAETVSYLPPEQAVGKPRARKSKVLSNKL